MENGFGVVFLRLKARTPFSEVVATLALIGWLFNPKIIILVHSDFTDTRDIRPAKSASLPPVYRHARHAVKAVQAEVQPVNPSLTIMGHGTPAISNRSKRLLADIPMRQYRAVMHRTGLHRRGKATKAHRQFIRSNDDNYLVGVCD
jgi:hypothetical protein